MAQIELFINKFNILANICIKSYLNTSETRLLSGLSSSLPLVQRQLETDLVNDAETVITSQIYL